MTPLQPTDSSLPSPISGNWYLLSVRSKKRDLFLKYLKLAILKNNLQELFLDIQVPQETVYEDIILLNLNSFKTAQNYLQKIEYFQAIERKPLPLEQVTRMLA